MTVQQLNILLTTSETNHPPLLSYTDSTANTGNTLTRQFGGTCGSTLFVGVGEDVVCVAVGSLDKHIYH
jgi:hypothetical protein